MIEEKIEYLDSCRGQIRSMHTKSKTIERRRLETLTQRNTKEKEGAKWEILREKEGGVKFEILRE